MKLDDYRIRNIRRNGKASAYEITQLADMALHFLEKQDPADILYNQAIADAKALGCKAIKLPEPYDDGHGNEWLPRDATIQTLKAIGFTVEGE